MHPEGGPGLSKRRFRKRRERMEKSAVTLGLATWVFFLDTGSCQIW